MVDAAPTNRSFVHTTHTSSLPLPLFFSFPFSSFFLGIQRVLRQHDITMEDFLHEGPAFEWPELNDMLSLLTDHHTFLVDSGLGLPAGNVRMSDKIDKKKDDDLVVSMSILFPSFLCRLTPTAPIFLHNRIFGIRLRIRLINSRVVRITRSKRSGSTSTTQVLMHTPPRALRMVSVSRPSRR